MGIVVAIFGMVVFLIGVLGASILGIIKAFEDSLIGGMFAMLVVGIVWMIIGSIIDSELN